MDTQLFDKVYYCIKRKGFKEKEEGGGTENKKIINKGDKKKDQENK